MQREACSGIEDANLNPTSIEAGLGRNVAITGLLMWPLSLFLLVLPVLLNGGMFGDVGTASWHSSIDRSILGPNGSNHLVFARNLAVFLIASCLLMRSALREFGSNLPTSITYPAPILAAILGSLPFYIGHLSASIFVPTAVVVISTLAVFARSMP